MRSGVTATPEKNPWSGHHAYMETVTLSWLTTDGVLSHFSGKINKARKGYESFVTDGLREETEANPIAIKAVIGGESAGGASG